MTYTLHLGDCLDILPTLEAGSVNCCITSPPYYGLRDYGVAGLGFSRLDCSFRSYRPLFTLPLSQLVTCHEVVTNDKSQLGKVVMSCHARS